MIKLRCVKKASYYLQEVSLRHVLSCFGSVLSSSEYFSHLRVSTPTGTTVLFSLNYCFLMEIVYKEKYLQYFFLFL